MASKSANTPVTLEVFDPTGASEVTEVHAPRLDTLDGKTICEISQEPDGQSWEARRTFPFIRELLKKRLFIVWLFYPCLHEFSLVFRLLQHRMLSTCHPLALCH